MKMMIFVIEAAVAVLSAWGLLQNCWKALRLAVVLGWLGALPGFIFVLVGSSAQGSQSLRTPKEELLGVSGVSLATAVAVLKGFGGVLLMYLVFGLPMFAPYMFLFGLIGGVLINRYSQPPSPRWMQPLAIVAVSFLAVVPIMLLDDGDLRRAAIRSSAFWAVVLLLARSLLFDPYRPTATGIELNGSLDAWKRS